MISQGARASRNGRTAEHVIADILTRHAVAYQRQHPIGTGIYGTPIRADFYLPTLIGFPDGLVIESKWQDVGGSADEKLPYLVANIIERYPCPTIVVIDGGGFRAGALAWLRTKVDGVRLYAVYSLTQFMSWTNRSMGVEV